MKRIRIGKDISMRWKITTDGVAMPLEGRDLTLEISAPMGIVSNLTYRVHENVLMMTYHGYEQKRIGVYSLTLWENKGKIGQNVVDVVRAFELVRTSQEEGDFIDGDLQKESVDVGTSNFEILSGSSAIDIDTLQAKPYEDSVNINGKTYSNESFTITLPKATVDKAGVMGASDVRTLKEHADSIAQIKTSCEENAADIDRVSNVVDTHESRLGSIDAEISSLQERVEEGVQQSDVSVSDGEESDSYDFAIADEKGNVILRLKDGGIFTKNFSSDGSTPGNPAISGVPEAPMDGKTYGRNNGAWNVITGKGESYLGAIEYTGQKIVFPKMYYKQLGTLPNNQQCCVIHNNLAIFVNGTKYWVTDKNNGFNVLKAGDVGVTGVHSNVGSLGIEFYNGNTTPLIYLTDWDGEKGVKVFNLSNTTYTMSRVQSINPSSELLNSDIFGRGNTDFIVDRENGFLYSICYKEDTWREIESNKTCICKFAIPRLNAGSNVTLSLSDIIDHFEVENIPTRQDCCIYNGILYIENGYVSPHYKATLRAIDLNQKKVVSWIDISKIIDGEPECLEFDGDHLLMAYGKTIYGLFF